MVAAPFTKKQKIKNKKENEAKQKQSFIQVICRRCRVGGKMWSDTHQVAGKKGLSQK